DEPVSTSLLMKYIRNLTGVSAPLALGLVARVSALFIGLATLHFVTKNLSPQIQGYYFTFGSLSQLTQLVDLGLQILVLQFASHEAANLTIGRGGKISGPTENIARLVSLGHFSLAWFGVLSTVLMMVMLVSGEWLFGSASESVAWQLPWILLCVLVPIDLLLNNFIWLLEGTNQLVLNYLYRLGRTIVTPVTLWILLEKNFGLM